MKISQLAIAVFALLALLATAGYFTLGEAALLRTLFYLSAAAFVAGLVWVFNADD